jgi:hypothetical protein
MNAERNEKIIYNLLLTKASDGRTILATCAVHGEGVIPLGMQQSFPTNIALEEKLEAAGIEHHRYHPAVEIVKGAMNSYIVITEPEALKLSAIVKRKSDN